jgi:hypothetical protein
VRATTRAADMMRGRRRVWRFRVPPSAFTLTFTSTFYRRCLVQSASPMASSQIFDSLPYYDNDLEQFPILKEKVERELAKEGEPPSTLHPTMSPELEIFAVSPR